MTDRLPLILLVATLAFGTTVALTGAAVLDGAAQSTQGQVDLSMTRQVSDGQSVVVDRVRLPDGGFVAIHDERLEPPDGDPVESVIGVSRYLSSGTHENVTVTLAQPLNGTEPTQVTAMPHRDTNRNEIFDFVTANGSVDEPYERENRPVTDPATIELSDEWAPPAYVSLANQTARGSVVAEDVTLSQGGFLAVVDEDGDVVGTSDYVEAETQDRVRIPVVERPDGATNLTVRAHLDTNGDRVFGFELSDGGVDGAYEAGTPSATARVRFPSEQGSPTPTPAFTATPTATPDSTPTGGFEVAPGGSE